VFSKLELDYAMWAGKRDDTNWPVAAETMNIVDSGLISHEPGYP
jgi:hypothetical protein